MSKQKHKYKVGQDIWYGDHFAKILKRLDGKMYQIKYSYFMCDNIIEVVSEKSLSMVGYTQHLNELRPL